MRIVHIVSSISKEASGPTYSVVRLCEELASQGNDVTLLTLDWAPLAKKPPFAKTFPLGLGPRRLGRSPAMSRWLHRHAEAGDIDILHAHNLWMMPNVYPGWVARRHGVPLVVSPRGTLTEYSMASGSKVKRLFWPLVQKPALDPVTCFHATAESELWDIRRLGFRQPVAVIPNGVGIVPYEPTPQRKMRTLLYLGRIHPEKGIEMLLCAWKRVSSRFPDWQLRLVGPGKPDYLTKMHILASSLDLPRCEFAGPRYGDDKWAEYRAAELYVLPSPSENFGLTIAEALMSGRPVVTTKGAPWEGLEGNGAGWWTEIGIEFLASALNEALDQIPSTLSEMGLRGRKWMMREFSWDTIGRDMARFYGWMLNGGTQPSFVRTD